MTSLTFLVSLFSVLLFLASIWTIHAHRRHGGLPYPPGPRPLPILGNLLDVPKDFSWLEYARLSKTYGDMLSFRVFGKIIVVLNSAKVAKDLLEKNGDIYYDRPVIPIHEMMGWQWSLPLARGNERWRRGRKVLDRGLRPGATASHRPMIQTRAGALLSRLLANTHHWEAHIELFQGESILAMTYGYEAQEHGDRMIDAAQRVNQFAIETILPGALLVNYLHFLRHIPEWLPWLSYKPLARIGHNLGNEVLYPPLQFVKESIRNGTALPSLALENFEEIENLELIGSEREKVEETIAGALASIFAAGADTTASAMKFFVMAMLLYPGIQQEAQNELDIVIGRDRLPTFEDRPRLPFIDAICKEVLRWHPVTPLAIPHAAMKDNVYDGFFIPKGAVVIGNSWAMLHDPTLYPEPDIFKPERFINTDGSLRDDPNLTAAFGFGKRICPGKHVVDATLFIVAASVLAAFNIKRGEGGGSKSSDYTITGAISSRPNPFPCSFVPRDEKARELDIMAR